MKKIITLLAAAFILTAAHTAIAANIQKPLYSEMKNSPNATRSEFCTLAYNLLSVKLGTELTDETGMFTDTDKAEINTLASLGIISGRGNGIFDPDGMITREEAARILCSLMDYMGIEDREIVGEQFKDFDTVSDWAKEYVAKVGRNEIMEGNGDGYVYNYAPQQVNTPNDTFHLYNSDFGPHQNYTVWQTKQTLYNLSGLLPERMGSENVTEYENVTIYSNKEYIWAERDGKVILSKPQGHYRREAELEGGRVVMSIGKCVYDLDTGKRLMQLRHSVVSMNTAIIATVAYFDMSFAGLGDMENHYYYDYDGNFIEDAVISSYGTPSELLDGNGNAHYILRKPGGEWYLTETYSLKPVVSGKSDIDYERKHIVSNRVGNSYGKSYPYFICAEIDDGRTLHQIYDLDGKKIFESEGKIEFVNNEYFICFDGDNSFAGTTADGERKFGVTGTEVQNGQGDYFILYNADTGLRSVYFYGGNDKRDEICDGFESSRGWKDILAVVRDGRSYILKMEDFSRITVIDGVISDRRDNYVIVKRGDKYAVLDNSWKDARNIDGAYSAYDDIIMTYPAEGEGEITVYNSETFEPIWNDTGEMAGDSNHYLLMRKDGTLYLNNVLTGGQNKVGGYLSSAKVSEEYGIAEVKNNYDITLYNENCEVLYTSEKSVKWDEKYIYYKEDEEKVKLLDLNGNTTGIEDKVVESMTINGKRLIVAGSDEKKYADVYDYDTLEKLFTLPGCVYRTGLLMYGHGYITTYLDGELLYYDENGNRVDISENE